MSDRFRLPSSGAPAVVRFPPIARTRLSNGLAVWALPEPGVPAVTAVFVLPRGCRDDPPDRHGLASLTGDLLDEGAGSRDAVALADAFARLGVTLNVEVGPDATSASVTVLSRFLVPTLELVADVVIRPRLAEPDFERVRDLRLNRLRQLRQSAGALADRAFVSAVYGGHPYGHGAFGTTDSLARMTPDDARSFWKSTFAPEPSTLVLCGAFDPDVIVPVVEQHFGAWRNADATSVSIEAPDAQPDARVVFVDRPGAPQSELRIGHLGPARRTPAYHALVVANAVIGGQFTSRINHRLREEKGVTYGARTSFDFRRAGGSFSCETSVQANATASAVIDILAECESVRGEGAVHGDELERAKASLTRGYVRNFETSGQLARAASALATYDLDDGTYDRFVPAVNAVTASDVHEATSRFIRPAEAAVVVVGDRSAMGQSLESIGRPIVEVTPDF